MTMNVRGAALAAASVLTMSLCSAAQAETTIRSIAAWSSNMGFVSDLLYPFQKAVTEATKGEIKFQNSGPEVVPPFDQFEPVSQGVFHMALSTPGYHQAQTGVGAFIDNFINADDPAALRTSGVMDWLNNYYRKNFGIQIIALYPSGENNFVLREPLSGDTRLNGRKIRTNAQYEGIVRALGGAPVQMSPADAYSAMQKGVLDGVAWPIMANAEFKLYEVAKFMTRPAFGYSKNCVIMNAAKFDSLTGEQQKAIVEAGKKLETEGTAYFIKLMKQQDETMMKNGVKITEFTPELASQIDKLAQEGGLKVAQRSRPNDVDALYKFAQERKMLKGQ